MRLSLHSLSLAALVLLLSACVSGGSGTDEPGAQDIVADASLGQDGLAADFASPDITPPQDTAPPEPTSQPDPLKAYSGGTCPTFQDGMNTFQSGGMERSVLLHIPTDPAGASVTFLWHGFGDSPQNFSAAFGAQQVSDEAHMIVVTPVPAIPVPGAGVDSWGFLAFGDTEADLTLFDDVLACLDENFDINELTVYTMGFSAGALFSSKLLLERSTFITAATLFSGGTDAAGPNILAIPYKTPGHKMPVLVVHGGVPDTWGGGMVLVKFNEGSADLAEKLTADEHPVILCDHGLGHTVPPGGASWGWEFLRTSYWGEGESQWIGHSGAPFPDYCTFP